MTNQDATINAVLQANRIFVKALQDAIREIQSLPPTLESTKLEQGLRFQVEQVMCLRIGMEHSLRDMQIVPTPFLVVAGVAPQQTMQ